MHDNAKQHLLELQVRFSVLAQQALPISRVTSRLIATFRTGGKLLVCGNGGSAADADHIVGELMKGFCLPRVLPTNKAEMLAVLYPEDGARLAQLLQEGLPAISLVSHASLLSAVLNDTAAEMVFAQQVVALGKPGDAVLGLSTSGNSRNVINALRVAKAFGMCPLGFCGAAPAQMDELCETVIHVPEEETYKIQELHLPIYHAICLAIETEFFGTSSN